MADGEFNFQQGVPERAPREVVHAPRDAGCQGVGAAAGITVHVAGLDWQAIADELTAHGYAIVPGLLTAPECAAVAASTRSRSCFAAAW